MDHKQAAIGLPGSRRRILFISESVTLAHLSRPLALARCLDPTRYEVVLACDSRYRHLIGDVPFPVLPIQSISSECFQQALARGRPLYDAETLRGYVREDLRVIRSVTPDVVVGDFRLSLTVSTRLTTTPYVALANAYWSPYARRTFPLPELTWVRYLGLPLARILFRLARPLAFAQHCVPLNRVLKENGLPPLGYNLCRTYTHADHTAYADVPELFPTQNLPQNHHYLGPILWSPACPLPDWWHQVPSQLPIIYATLGSSGQRQVLPIILEALADLPVTVLAATAGNKITGPPPSKAYIAEYLPGEQAAARARLVICNGGSPTTQQALVAGVPVLGIASNMDQFLNMAGVCRVGAGKVLRTGSAQVARIRTMVMHMLNNDSYARGASEAASILSRYDPAARIGALLSEIDQRDPK